MHDIDHINTFQAQSPTAVICENAALYGATPERGEFDPREIWDRGEATAAVSEAFRVLAERVAPDGFQLADEREHLLWGLVNAFDAQVRRLDRSVDRLSPRLRDLQNAQDGSEINARELELATDRARNLGDRRDAFEQLRDTADDAYRAATGDRWRPRRGSHTSQTRKLTSAAIDARDFQRACKDREINAHLPDGTLVAVNGFASLALAGYAAIGRRPGASPRHRVLRRSPASALVPMAVSTAVRTPRFTSPRTGPRTDAGTGAGGSAPCRRHRAAHEPRRE